MKKVEIEMKIDKKGEVHFLIKGIKGPGCMKYVEIFKELLGEIKNFQHTPEYYEQDVEIQRDIRIEEEQS